MHRIIRKAQKKRNNYSHKIVYYSDDNLSESDEENSLDMTNVFVNNKYVFLNKISRGTFSSVWLVYDIIDYNFKTAKLFSNPSNIEEYNNEVDIFKIINKSNKNIVEYYESLDYNNNKIIILELLGISLLDIINDINDDILCLDIINVKEIYKQILKGYTELHTYNIIHADIKPDNILFNILPNYLNKIINYVTKLDMKNTFLNFYNELLPNDFDDFHKSKKKNIRKKIKIKTIKALKDYLIEQLKKINIYDKDNSYDFDLIKKNNFVVKIIDFSNSEPESNISQNEIYTRPYRALDNIINLNYTKKTDIWAIGCLFYEILTGNYLFDITHNSKINKDIDHIYNIYKTFNNHNEFINTIQNCDYYDNFFINDNIKIKNNYDILSLNEKLLQYSKIENNLNETNSFLKLFFIYNPTFRPNTTILLQHNYLIY